MSLKSPFTSIKKTIKSKIALSVLRKRIKPPHDFAAKAEPLAPDYSNLDHWAAHPELKSSALLTPVGVDDIDHNQPADLFYIYPTMCFSNEHWNAPLDYERTNEFVDNMILPGQASIFNSCCRIFAPRYRQVTFYTFMEASQNSHSALELAYLDVLTAFKYYLTHENKGRPFIIAGHSQGSVLGVRLLEEVIDKTELIDQMIAAYLIGFQIPKDKIGRTLNHITAAQSENDLGCIVAYDTFGETGGPLHDRDNCQHYYHDTKSWEYRKHRDVISINPLNWSTSTSLVKASNHKGSVKLNFTKESNFNWQNFFSDDPMGIEIQSLDTPRLNECSARLDGQGFLHISEPNTRSYRLGLMPNENYHIHDMALFYMNLRENVKKRVDAFITH